MQQMCTEDKLLDDMGEALANYRADRKGQAGLGAHGRIDPAVYEDYLAR